MRPNVYEVVLDFLFITILICAAGCTDRKGTAVSNRPPHIAIVNTPPDDAIFSRNPELYWYATDIDGYITYYRYAVIPKEELLIGNTPMTPEEFIDLADDKMYPWDTAWLSLDNPQSHATIQLYADLEDPVQSNVEQYFFIQACDDGGLMSEICWRKYGRNNHYPNTHHRADAVYINAPDDQSPAPGIHVSWAGADSLDWGRTEPPLDYEWRLYGPFEKDAPIYVNIAMEDCITVPGEDDPIDCREVPVLDIDRLPDAIAGLPQPLRRSQGPHFAGDTNDVWVTDLETTIYGVFNGLGDLTKTSQYKFIFWVRTRDDGFLPDPTPAFSQFLVIEAKFEKDVAVLDETDYRPVSRWYPKDLAQSKSIYYDYINTALERIHGFGARPFDTVTTTAPGAPPDYRTDYFFMCTATGTDSLYPDLIDLLSHKVILYYNDDAVDGAYDSLMAYACFAMDMGASGWAMGRNLVNADEPQSEGPVIMDENLRTHFGIESIDYEGWLFHSLYRYTSNYPGSTCETRIRPQWNEQYIGCEALHPELFPAVDMDMDFLNERYRYLDENMFIIFGEDTFCVKPQRHVLDAMPEVGTCVRTNQALPVYLYKSKYGDLSKYSGKVMGVALDNSAFRSAAFLFTPIATEREQTIDMFTATLSWLTEGFGDQGATAAKISNRSCSAQYTVEQRRNNVRRFLRDLHERGEGDPRLFDLMGVSLSPPIVSQSWR